MKQNKFLSKLKSQLAFTMIELLIVIAILGILAVAVLAAINPIEQINRGRDTGSRSDAEQLLSAIDRFYAYKGYYPWVSNPNNDAALVFRGVSLDTSITVDGGSIDAWADDSVDTPCYVLDKIANGNTAGTCVGTNEVKRSFVDKVIKTDYNHLYVFYSGDPGESLYVCFKPQSGAMQEEAATRCIDEAGSGLPDDLQSAAASVCVAGEEYSCLP
ncbi:type II secretion system GspH family protein [Patescibacteria group bacterium]|nr:type II secretion system GspH family protein [Patescibacteria group bacterium]